MGGHHHHHHHHQGDAKNLLIACGLNFGFCLIQFVGGYLTNSVSITSDALHDLGDSMALLFAYYAEKVGLRSPDQKFTYGYRRFSVLAALLNGLILVGGSLYVLTESVQRIKNPEAVIPEGMLLLAILGLLVNGFAFMRLKKSQGHNAKMIQAHFLEDILGWVAVFIVSIVLFFYPLYILDSILSILIAFLILRNVWGQLVQIFVILMHKFPSDLGLQELTQKIQQFPEVQDVHAFRGYALDYQNYSLSFHVVVPGETTVFELNVLRESIKRILSEGHVTFSSIEFESSGKCS